MLFYKKTLSFFSIPKGFARYPLRGNLVPYKFDFNKSGGDFTVRGGQWFHKSPSAVATPKRSQNLPFFNPSP